ncbi:MAG TPA: apolipoprotein N-acyltransferase [Gammaproteobacteria bacterium]|nr:apolipoprotein N-acyltransferase [Gammaproteobacteria bacterium]
MSYIPLPPSVRYIAALLAGGLMTVAFAPMGWWFFAFFCMAALVYLWLDATPREAAMTGYFFGLGFFGIGVSWVYNSIHEFGQAPAVVAGMLTVLFVLTLAAFPALVGWLQAPRRRWNARLTPRLLLVLPALWVLVEWFRGWVLTGFPWLQLGYSQIDTLFSWPVPILGVLGASWVVLVLVGALFLIASGSLLARSVAVSAVALTLVFCLQSGRLRWTTPADRSLDVRLIQGNIAQENKWRKEWLIPTVDLYESLTKKNLKADLIVWPEVALPGEYQLFRKSVLDPLKTFLKARSTVLVTGVLYRSDKGVHNAMMRLGPVIENEKEKNEDTQIYLKRHLVPFGEFIPFRDTLSWIGDMIILPAADLSPGERANTLSIKGFEAAGSICYEDAYGAELAEMLPKANLLINISNDAWFGDSLAPHQHLEISRMRALETGRPLLRATNTGISATIDYRGTLRKVSPQFQVDVLEDEITPRYGATPFARWGNGAVLVMMLLSLLTGLVLGRPRRPDGEDAVAPGLDRQ